MKQNIEFYPHFSNSDQHAKFKMLRVQFGWEGEGKFWALNNRIALAEGCFLDISKKYNKAAIANDLNFSISEFDNFIIFLEKDCELIKKCKDGGITTDIIQETYVKVMAERDKARERHRRTSGEKEETSGEEIHKGKDTKVKNTKKESKGEKKTKNFSPPSLEDLKTYCRERQNNINPETFIDFYTAKNWMIGKNKMKDWKAAVRTWEQRNPKTVNIDPYKNCI